MGPLVTACANASATASELGAYTAVREGCHNKFYRETAKREPTNEWGLT